MKDESTVQKMLIRPRHAEFLSTRKFPIQNLTINSLHVDGIERCTTNTSSWSKKEWPAIRFLGTDIVWGFATEAEREGEYVRLIALFGTCGIDTSDEKRFTVKQKPITFIVPDETIDQLVDGMPYAKDADSSYARLRANLKAVAGTIPAGGRTPSSEEAGQSADRIIAMLRSIPERDGSAENSVFIADIVFAEAIIKAEMIRLWTAG